MSATPESDYQHFATRVGATFTVAVEPEGNVDLELVECSPAVTSGGWFSYSLSFRGSAATPLGQGTFIFDAEGLEPSAIFIVPVSSSSLGIVYDAHFTVQEG
ncbi:hypothetical protein GCM10022381_19400 [Leifsonia kafniensis]|uniref:DUF6916 domain-containing protein n=1 Tax=Leifsonia kafniensis TaxID=475957 RepID=A0ABP7KJ62_9MICO